MEQLKMRQKQASVLARKMDGGDGGDIIGLGSQTGDGFGGLEKEISFILDDWLYIGYESV